MRTLLFTALFVLPLLGFSQKVKKPKAARPAPQWDTLFFKNEFSLDVSPAIGFVTGGALSTKQSVGAVYRRFLDKNDAIRIAMRHTFNNYNSFVTGGMKGELGFFGYDSIFAFKPGDTVYSENYYQTNYYSPDLRVGYEHRFGKRRFKCMLGMDLLAGIERISRTEVHRYYTFQILSDSSETYYTLVHSGNPADAHSGSDAINLKIGAAPFVGLQVHLSRRFSLNASAMFDIFWTMQLYGNDKYGGFNLDSDALVADVGLTVHF